LAFCIHCCDEMIAVVGIIGLISDQVDAPDQIGTAIGENDLIPSGNSQRRF